MRASLFAALVLGGVLAVAPAVGAQAPAPAAEGVSNAASVLGPPRGAPLTGDALETETKRVAGLLRCPVCQGASVAESPSSMAQNMRRQVRELVAAGYDEDQVLRYFERSYGPFVRLEPPLAGVNWTLWLAPVVGLVAGALFVGWTLRRPKTETAPATVVTVTDAPPTPDALPDDPELARYVLRVRERAFGWPGGVRP
jgi:cytochrome c-type biogenesis protein CcmH